MPLGSIPELDNTVFAYYKNIFFYTDEFKLIGYKDGNPIIYEYIRSKDDYLIHILYNDYALTLKLSKDYICFYISNINGMQLYTYRYISKSTEENICESYLPHGPEFKLTIPHWKAGPYYAKLNDKIEYEFKTSRYLTDPKKILKVKEFTTFLMEQFIGIYRYCNSDLDPIIEHINLTKFVFSSIYRYNDDNNGVYISPVLLSEIDIIRKIFIDDEIFRFIFAD